MDVQKMLGGGLLSAYYRTHISVDYSCFFSCCGQNCGQKPLSEIHSEHYAKSRKRFYLHYCSL